MGRPSRPKLGRRGHWNMGGSAGGDTVARGPAVVPVAAPGNATAVVVGPIGVPEVPAV